MKKLLLLLFFALPAFANIGIPYVPLVQSSSQNNSGNSSTCSFDRPVTSGNVLIVFFTWITGTATPTVSDTLSNTWTQRVFNTSNTIRIAVYTATASSSGSDGITTSGTSYAFVNSGCGEFAPLWSMTVDASAVSTFSGTPSTISPTGVTTTKNGDLVINYIGGFRNAGRLDVNSGSIANWTQFINKNNNDSEGGAFKLGGVNGSESMTWNNVTNDIGTAVTVAFAASSISITSYATAPDGALTNSYNWCLEAIGGAGTYTWSISSGSLQNGLSLNTSTGCITGTPTSATTNSITFQVSDGTNSTTKAVSLKVGASLNTISVVQSKNSSQAAGESTWNFASNVTAGNLEVIVGGWNKTLSQAVSPCSSNRGTVFQTYFFRQTTRVTGNDNLGGIYVQLGFIGTSGAESFTCQNMYSIAEISNVQYIGNDNTDVTRGNTATPATVTSNSLTTLVPNEILLGMCFSFTNGSADTIQSPFTAFDSNHVGLSSGYRVVTTVTGYTVSCSYTSNTSGTWMTGLVGLRPSAGATVAVPEKLKHINLTELSNPEFLAELIEDRFRVVLDGRKHPPKPASNYNALHDGQFPLANY